MNIRVGKIVFILMLSAGILIGNAGVGSASHWQWKHDGNDFPGVVDLKRAGIKIPRHSTSGNKGMVSCRGDAYEDLAPEQIVGFYCYYDTKGDDQFEWGLLGQWTESGLTATAYNKQGEASSTPVKISIKDGDIVMEMKKKKFHGRDDFLRWRMQTYTSEDGFDSAPNSGGYYKYIL